MSGRMPWIKRPGGKRQHIGRTIHIALFAVDLVNVRIVRKAQVGHAGLRYALCGQAAARHAQKRLLRALRHRQRAVKIKVKFIHFRSFLSCFHL